MRRTRCISDPRNPGEGIQLPRSAGVVTSCMLLTRGIYIDNVGSIPTLLFTQIAQWPSTTLIT